MACGRHHGRNNVEVHHGILVDFSCGPMTLPLRDKRNTRAAFVGGHLESAQAPVLRGGALGRPAVISDVEDQGVLFESELPDFGHHPTDRVVLSRKHRCKQLTLWVFDIREAVQVLLGCLKRRVLGVERHIQKPRFVFVLFEPIDRSLGIGVCGIEIFVGYFADIVRDTRIDEVRWMKERGIGQCTEELIEATFRRPVFLRASEVPFSDTAGGISEFL